MPLLWAFLAARAGGFGAPGAVAGPPGAAGAARLAAAPLAAARAAVPPILRTLPPLAIAAAITVAYNLVRFGDALEFGYKEPVDPGFTTPLWEGARGLLLSPEKSIVLFAPAVVLVPFALAALWRAGRARVRARC